MVINLYVKDRDYSSFEACYFGMKSIFENSANKKLIHPKVISDLAQHRFEIEAISLIKVRNQFSCDVIAQDPKGYRSYLVTLEKNSSFDHFYRIFDVKGQKIISDYQIKEIEGGGN